MSEDKANQVQIIVEQLELLDQFVDAVHNQLEPEIQVQIRDAIGQLMLFAQSDSDDVRAVLDSMESTLLLKAILRIKSAP
jgi:hypothetical protein